MRPPPSRTCGSTSTPAPRMALNTRRSTWVIRYRPAQSLGHLTIAPPNGCTLTPTPQPRSPRDGSVPPNAAETFGNGVNCVDRLAVPGSGGSPSRAIVAPGVGSVQSSNTLTNPPPRLTDGP